MNLNYLLFILIVLLIIINHKQTNNQIYIYDSDTDDEDYLQEPTRFYESKYIPKNKLRINYPTRGYPPSYQQVGIITDSTDGENIKPLYGRQTYRGSNSWNYFTSLDSHLATKIPIIINNNDCTDERGCRELQKGDTISMGEGGNSYNASIYKTIVPRYIPY